MIGLQHHFLVVFDDNDRVASVSQRFEALDQTIIISLVQADARLIQDVKYFCEFATYLRSEPNALRLSSGQCS
jgi:hypothetical protein